ncbi:flagellar export chaperone FliS [Breoghania sp. L-A4]|uniref:flagellar export chaperone FliS n=1 Tax=Breoghania sp. L-A4 TaxID=2304600 RepID=UPI0013C32F63|nr:flagellar export chaperone FliS [Breoghania sp. L-A4]
MTHAISAYRQAATAVPPVTAVVRLYDEAINAIHRTIKAHEAGRFDEAYANVQHAVAILRGLRQALDLERSGLVGRQLNQMYSSNILALTNSIGKANAAARLRKLIEGLIDVRDAWASMTPIKPRAEESGADYSDFDRPTAA